MFFLGMISLLRFQALSILMAIAGLALFNLYVPSDASQLFYMHSGDQ